MKPVKDAVPRIGVRSDWTIFQMTRSKKLPSEQKHEVKKGSPVNIDLVRSF